MLEDPTSKPLKSCLTLKGKSFLHNKRVGDRLHPSWEVFAYLVLRGNVRLNPQFANLSSSSMGAIGPGVNSIEEVLEFPVKRMSKGAKIHTSSTHKEGLTWSWSSHLQSLFVDLVNTVSRDNVSILSTPVEDRYDIFHFEDVDNEVLQRYNSHTYAVCALLLLCIPVHQNCLVICGP